MRRSPFMGRAFYFFTPRRSAGAPSKLVPRAYHPRCLAGASSKPVVRAYLPHPDPAQAIKHVRRAYHPCCLAGAPNKLVWRAYDPRCLAGAPNKRVPRTYPGMDFGKWWCRGGIINVVRLSNYSPQLSPGMYCQGTLLASGLPAGSERMPPRHFIALPLHQT